MSHTVSLSTIDEIQNINLALSLHYFMLPVTVLACYFHVLTLVALVVAGVARPLSLGAHLTWTLSNRNGSVVIPEAPIPGYVLDALQSSGLIGPPLYRCACCREPCIIF